MKSTLANVDVADNYYQILEMEKLNTNKENTYNAFIVDRFDNQPQLHLVPILSKIGSHSQRIFDTYYPFGFKNKRCI